jgi:Na+-driven multidrug efflux pump
VGVVLVAGIAIGSLIVVFGESLLGIFAPENEEAIRLGMVRIRYMASTYFLCGIMEVGSGVLRGFGNGCVQQAQQ